MRNTPDVREIITSAMATKKMSQSDLARLCNLKESTISRILHAKSEQIDDKTVDKLCLGLGLHKGSLLVASGVDFGTHDPTGGLADKRLAHFQRWLATHPAKIDAIMTVAEALGYCPHPK